MQAVLDAPALKQLVRALTCLARYGEELIILASPERLLLHTTNSSQTAYGRVVYNNRFFARYRVDSRGSGDVDGQLMTKALLSVLKPKTLEKSVSKCELTIVHGGSPANGQNDEDYDGLESKLIVRLHCKHGVVKTHRLQLSETTRHMAPNVPESAEESNLSISPKSLKDILDHFNVLKAGKGDPQLIWTFDVDTVHVRSKDTLAGKGKNQIATELSVAADEFINYDIFVSPTTIAFHLREFSAMMAFAESSGLTINLQFTVSGNPLFIQPEGGECYETLFIISLSEVAQENIGSQTSNRPVPQYQPRVQPQGKKRPLESDTDHSPARANGSMAGSQLRQQSERTPIRTKAPMKTIVRTNRAESSARDVDSPGGSMPPPVMHASATKRGVSISQGHNHEPAQSQQPLFLPGSQLSQLPRSTSQAIIESGLGIENMDADEFVAMLEGEGEEVGLDNEDEDTQDEDAHMRESSLDILDTDTQLPPTQESVGSRVFKPLFDD